MRRKPHTLGTIGDELDDLLMRRAGLDEAAVRGLQRELLDALAVVPHMDSPLPPELALSLRRRLRELTGGPFIVNGKQEE